MQRAPLVTRLTALAAVVAGWVTAMTNPCPEFLCPSGRNAARGPVAEDESGGRLGPTKALLRRVISLARARASLRGTPHRRARWHQPRRPQRQAENGAA